MFAIWAALAVLAAQEGRPEIRVGIDEGDLRGSDQRVLQAAVDQVAALGGGTVRIGPGRYVLRNALVLRNGVRIVGEVGKTVLAACDAAKSALAVDGDCNERQVTLEDPSGFRVGDGIAVRDRHYGGGFEVTTATLAEKLDARTFRISAPLYLDYLVSRKAVASLSFPVVGGWQAKDVVLEGLTIDGNRDRAERLDGCRGGGIYLFECERVTIRGCVVRRYHGDGISFQTSGDVTVEDCAAEENSGIGLHPGSGSQRPVMRRNRSVGNGQDGMYVCWRVRYGRFEGNDLRNNARDGISIGHKDTNNMFRLNIIKANERAGVMFREESEPMGAHGNLFEKNIILDNGKKARAAVVMEGHHHDVVFRGNRIGNSEEKGPSAAGFWIGKNVRGLIEEDNEFENVAEKVVREK